MHICCFILNITECKSYWVNIGLKTTKECLCNQDSNKCNTTINAHRQNADNNVLYKVAFILFF